ncbi:MAG TPA: SMP-30/gluconolactonase/LRE family protein [Hypericibacter adhaerens]|jgi:ribose transport system permease protein|uniref:ABC transporter permease n=1 Tax=Hypericibacter adhaerens TaxID=2602016 RepID=A0A5J6MTT6_9PROT|nr:SMP-30/gluconolactonase/LRE family protein [Hypericibacter adhaerens]QEX20643.1 ABC transporter permease [Hypericibacter adhaerens]HWA45098.1 SMP-30/gluconolactonase/LRE family protein [Hypericibacter adhaerens]
METIERLYFRYFPEKLLGEVLTKRWSDNVVPVLAAVCVVAFFLWHDLGFFTVASLTETSRQLSEFVLVVVAMGIVLLAGGLDLSLGSVFALANITALICMNLLGWPVWASIAATLAVGALCGAVNGFLIGYLRIRAFLTTLVTLIIIRSIVDIILLRYAVQISAAFPDSDVWDFLGEGMVLGVPFSFIVAIVVIAAWHVVLTRARAGWHITAVGGSRRSAFNAGLKVKFTVFMTYVWSSLLASVAGIFFAARLGSAGSDTGVGLEIAALTAAVLGGNSLGGGRGSVAKSVLGAIVIIILTDSMVRIGISGGISSTILGLVLLLVVAIDVRWLKNRSKILNKVYVSPAYFRLPPAPETDAGTVSPYALNDRLREVSLIGKGKIEGPEDVIFDRRDNLYCPNRHGDIVRFLAPDYERWEIFVHIGGHPLGMAFDADDNLDVCIGGMGLYQVSPDRQVRKLTDETNRSFLSVIDDSRLKLADDLDIAPDGRIFFSEATIRYDMHDWAYDALESRGNGRLICYDPRDGSTRTVLRNLQFPNGVCMAGDGQSFFFAETWGCRINRYWFDGPKKGQCEVVIPDLPGYPDNINRASDGNFWVALVGMRSPAMDLALRMPSLRKRMAKHVARDEWLFPNINTGCVLKFGEAGQVLESLWDLGGINHPMVTSMREHKGYLYLGGLYNDRIGRLKLPGADPNWTSQEFYWGRKP